VRASTRAQVTESASGSRRHPGPSCASPAPDLMAAWCFSLFASFVPVRDEP
jgi:hypothetical protein